MRKIIIAIALIQAAQAPWVTPKQSQVRGYLKSIRKRRSPMATGCHSHFLANNSGHEIYDWKTDTDTDNKKENSIEIAFNLLINDAKKKIKRQYRLRFSEPTHLIFRQQE